MTDSGSCVTNGNGVIAAYGVQSCNVAVLRQGVLSAPVGFNIDAMASLNVRGYVAGDGYTLLGGTVFSSQQSPANQRVEAGDALFWRYGWDATNVSVFRVCASRFVAALPTACYFFARGRATLTGARASLVQCQPGRTSDLASLPRDSAN